MEQEIIGASIFVPSSPHVYTPVRARKQRQRRLGSTQWQYLIRFFFCSVSRFINFPLNDLIFNFNASRTTSYANNTTIDVFEIRVRWSFRFNCGIDFRSTNTLDLFGCRCYVIFWTRISYFIFNINNNYTENEKVQRTCQRLANIKFVLNATTNAARERMCTFYRVLNGAAD